MVLENLLLKTDRSDVDGPQYHVHHGPCCASECAVLQNSNTSDDFDNDDNEAPEHDNIDPPNHISRKRTLSTQIHNNNHEPASSSSKRVRRDCLPSHILDVVIDTYFKTAHHWIPFLHERRFRERLLRNSEREKLEIVIHAMTYIAVRLVSHDVITKKEAEEIARESKEMVLMRAFDDLSVENLQALAMIAFEHVCDILLIIDETDTISSVAENLPRLGL